MPEGGRGKSAQEGWGGGAALGKAQCQEHEVQSGWAFCRKLFGAVCCANNWSSGFWSRALRREIKQAKCGRVGAFGGGQVCV